jgi:hypothetical protein
MQWYAHYLPMATARYVDVLDSTCSEVPAQPLAPMAPTSTATDNEEETLTAEAAEGFANAPRVIRTPDLLIRRRGEGATAVATNRQGLVLSAFAA